MPNILEEETRGREEVKHPRPFTFHTFRLSPFTLSPFRLSPFLFQIKVDGEVKVYEGFYEEGREEKEGRQRHHKFRVDI